MTDKERKPTKYDGNFFRGISNEIRLVFRLMADNRIQWWLKSLPFASLLYFIFPDIAPGPIDDALVIFIGVYTFIELCPPAIVDEHRDSLRKTIPGEWRDAEPENTTEIIEGEIIDSKNPEKEIEA